MSEDIAGRDAELEAVEDFLAKTSMSLAALVLEGEAGMGKTTLWRAAVENAQARGLTVLQAEPVESETTLSFAGIGDLLDPFLDEVLDGLAPVQRRALERALALGEEEGPALDPRVLRVAVMNALRALAAERPVLLAIDDSQWLDFASSAALAYGARDSAPSASACSSRVGRGSRARCSTNSCCRRPGVSSAASTSIRSTS